MYELDEVRPNQTETEKIMRRKLKHLPKKHQRALKQCAKHLGGGWGVLRGPADQMKLADEALDMIFCNLTAHEEQAVIIDAMAAMRQMGVGATA